MINEPHAITAETAGFFFRDDVTYLAHNRVSSFPSLAKGAEKRQGASRLLPFLRSRTAPFSLPAIFLSPKHVCAFLRRVFVRDPTNRYC